MQEKELYVYYSNLVTFFKKCYNISRTMKGEPSMCKLRNLTKDIRVAEIKYAYIVNIIKQAQNCKNISKIILFGSSIEERCKPDSDIDIAVFGDKKPYVYLKSAEFRNFNDNVFSFNDFDGQDYDILYFTDNIDDNSDLMKNIRQGAEIYRRAA